MDNQNGTVSSFEYPKQILISILPKNHAGTVEKLISDFFRMPKKAGAIDSL